MRAAKAGSTDEVFFLRVLDSGTDSLLWFASAVLPDEWTLLWDSVVGIRQ